MVKYIIEGKVFDIVDGKRYDIRLFITNIVDIILKESDDKTQIRVCYRVPNWLSWYWFDEISEFKVDWLDQDILEWIQLCEVKVEHDDFLKYYMSVDELVIWDTVIINGTAYNKERCDFAPSVTD